MKKTLFALALIAVATVMQAQVVGATNRQNGSISSSTNDPVYRPTGAVLHFEAGSPWAAAVGYQVTSNVMVGAGFGYYYTSHQHSHYESYHYESFGGGNGGWYPNTFSIEGDPNGPFLEMRGSTPGYRWSVFGDVKLGYNLASYYPDSAKCSRIYIGLQAGIGYKNLSLGAGALLIPGVFTVTNSQGIREKTNFTEFSLSLSYNLPVAYLRRVLMF